MSNIKTLKKKDYIRVYNPSPSMVGLTMKDRGCCLEGNDYIDLTWEEIRWLNDKSVAFKNGSLLFDKEDEEAMYEAIGIFNWRDILFQEEIDDILLNPTIEKMQRVIGVNDIHTIERVRGRMIFLENNDYDVRKRVNDVVNTRWKEIRDHKKGTNITLVAKESIKPVDEKEVNVLRDEVAELKAMIEELKKGK